MHSFTFAAAPRESRKGPPHRRQESVKIGSILLNWTDADAGADIRRRVNVWSGMSVVAYTAVTVAIFTLLGFVQKWVEQL